nr:hypothetical protein Iba_chr10aCG2880 [Ipomoea batatas]
MALQRFHQLFEAIQTLHFRNLCNATKKKNRLLFDTHQPRICSFNIRCLAIINPGYAIVINMNNLHSVTWSP